MVQFGSFDDICKTSPLVICPLIGTSQGIEATCYSRNVEIAKTLIFQPAACFVHIVAICMTAIMIYHVRSKYTAVGRKEIVTFFYLYMVIELLAIFLDSGVIPTASTAYPWFAAVYSGLVTATYTCLLINGFVGFQFAEDGTPLSLWALRLASLASFGISFFISIATFKEFAGFSYAKPLGLWIIYLLWPLICVIIYIVLQLVLVIRTLEDRWPIGDIIFGVAFFAVAQVVLFAFSVTICDAVKHYIDGLFFFTLCMLLSVMMVYKYWDSITKEDLEFSVGSKQAVWEVKDPLLAGRGAGMEYPEDDMHTSYGGATPGLSPGGHGSYYQPQGGAAQGYGYPPQGYERY